MNSWFWFFGALFFMYMGISSIAEREPEMGAIWMAGSVSYGALWAQEM
jgi:hypothetical protein